MEVLAKQLPPKAYRRFWSSLFSSRAFATQFLASSLCLATQLEATIAPAPASPVSPALSAPGAALDADGALLDGPPQPAEAQGAPAGGGAGQGAAVPPVACSSRAALVRALHFAATFARYDALEPEYKAALDEWAAVVGSRQDSFTQELLATLLLGNPSDPFWNWAEKCLQPSSSLALPVLRELLLRQDCYRKVGADIVAQLAMAESPCASLLGSLRLLEVFVTHCPYDTCDVVSSAIPIVRERCLLPGVCGARSLSALRLLQREAAAPGSAQRELIFSEWPEAGVPPRPPRLGGWALIAEENHEASALLASMLLFWSARVPVGPQLRFNVLSNLLSRVLGIEAENVGLQFLLPERVDELFQRASALCRSACKMEIPAAREFLWRELFVLHKDALDSVCKAPRRQRAQVLRVPPLPVDVQSVACAALQADSVTVTDLRIPVCEPFVNALLSCIANAAATETGSPRRERADICIAVAGSDRLLFALSGAYVQLCKEAQALLERARIRFCLVPVAPDSLACAELQRVDPWFAGNVVEPLAYCMSVTPGYPFSADQPRVRSRAPTACPDEQQQRQPDGDSDGQAAAAAAAASADRPEDLCGRAYPSPPSLVASVVESVMREASAELPVRIALCQCYSEAGGLLTLPFVAECAVFTPSDVLCLRTAKPVPMTVSLAHRAASLSPAARPGPLVRETRRVHSVRFRCDWLHSSLEMLGARSDDDGGGARQRFSTPAPAEGARQRRGRRAQGTEIAEAEVLSDGGRSSLCVAADRQVFGPFSRVAVAASPYVLPVAAFDAVVV
eukprot:m51a1_g11385 hypothetical protein (796) ;mRNA; r:7395-10327